MKIVHVQTTNVYLVLLRQSTFASMEIACRKDQTIYLLFKIMQNTKEFEPK